MRPTEDTAVLPLAFHYRNLSTGTFSSFTQSILNTSSPDDCWLYIPSVPLQSLE